MPWHAALKGRGYPSIDLGHYDELMISAGQRRNGDRNRNRAQRRAQRIGEPTFTEALLRSNDPKTLRQRLPVIAVSSVFAICGVAACLDAIDSFWEEGSGVYFTALLGLLLLAAGLVGFKKTISKKVRSQD
jgi:hypothetical protein